MNCRIPKNLFSQVVSLRSVRLPCFGCIKRCSLLSSIIAMHFASEASKHACSCIFSRPPEVSRIRSPKQCLCEERSVKHLIFRCRIRTLHAQSLVLILNVFTMFLVFPSSSVIYRPSPKHAFLSNFFLDVACRIRSSSFRDYFLLKNIHN